MNNKNERTKAAAKNALITLISQFFYIIVSFLCRTIFTKVLGTEYLGLAGLFTNILYILSFVELGIGTSVAYKLYKPLSQNDERQVCIYVNFFKKVYLVIVTMIAILGIFLIPFLGHLIPNYNVTGETRILYILYLIDTIVSYLYVHKKSLLIADQKNYVVEVYTRIFNIVLNVGQIIVLYYSHEFVLYLVLKIVIDLVCNFVLAKRVDHDYPYINSGVSGDISIDDKIEFKKNLKGLLIGKITSVVYDGTDNFFITLFDGISTVGIISNYTLIINTINSLINSGLAALTASIGKLSVEEKTQHVEKVFKRLYFINSIVYGYIFVGFTLLIQLFVTQIWLDDTYTIPKYLVFAIILEMCLRGMSYPLYSMRTALGYFYQYRWVGFFCAILNLSLDYILGIVCGVTGIFLATIISRTITRVVDVIVVYKFYFHRNPLRYYLMHLKQLGFIVIVTSFNLIVIKRILIDDRFFEFFVKFILISCIYFIFTVTFFGRTSVFLELKNMVKSYVKRK